jgi:phosphate transport system permease protein
MIAVLMLILWTVVKGSLPAWHWSVFIQPTQGLAGGLENAILGSLWLGLLTVIVEGVVGVATATFAAVYAPLWLREGMLFVSDILSGIPSIVFGFVGYLTFVLAFGWGFSALAAVLTLTMLSLPYVVRNTFEALQKVPEEIRDGARALGFSRARTTWSVMWPSAGRGIATGAILALSIAMGETAPLLYTADWSQTAPSLALTHQSVAYLTYVVWTFIQEPYPQANALAYMAGLLLMILIGALSFAARFRSRQ